MSKLAYGCIGHTLTVSSKSAILKQASIFDGPSGFIHHLKKGRI